MLDLAADPTWSSYLQRYRQGEWRAKIFRDLILADFQNSRANSPPVVLDIGCGRGFDGDPRLQGSLASAASSYVGVEPDPDVDLASFFSTVHRCPFEAAPIPDGSVDLAFTVMVLEHLDDPATFWNKVHAVLRPGGVFWGFTMDARHWFVRASLLAKRLRVKDVYLNWLHGRRGDDRYENYPVCYRSNTPGQLDQLTRAFQSRGVLSIGKVGQLDYYFPSGLRWLSRALDRRAIRRDDVGSLLAVRVVK